MFKKIIKKYADKRLKEYFNHSSLPTRIMTLKDSRSVGILWNPQDEGGVEAYEALRRNLQSRGIKTCGLAHLDTNREQETLSQISSSDFLIKRNATWYGKPKVSPAIDFCQESFDLLIDLSIKKSINLQYILIHSRAAFKVGWQGEETNFYDLNIDVAANPSTRYLMEQIIYFLDTIKEKI